MHFYIEPKTLRTLVKTVSPVVDKKSSLQTLGQIHIQAEGGRVIMSATSVESTIKAFRTDLKVDEEGVTCVNGATFSTIVNSLKGDSVSMIADGNKAQIKCGSAKFNLKVSDPEAFPVIPNYSSMDFKSVATGFIDILSKVSFATGEDESRPTLLGIHIRPNEMVGLDGHRMAILTHRTPTEHDIIVPSSHLSHVVKALSYSDYKDDLSICVDGNDIHFFKEDTAASIRLLAGKYPNYEGVVPKGVCQEVTINRQSLIDSIKMVLLISDGMNYVKFEAQDGKLKLSARSQDTGDAEDTIDCKHEAPFEIALNGKYVVEALDKLTEEEVIVEIRGSTNPLVLKEEGYLHVIMPQRLQ